MTVCDLGCASSVVCADRFRTGAKSFTAGAHTPRKDVFGSPIRCNFRELLYLMVVRGSARKRLRVQDSAETGLAVSALLCGRGLLAPGG